MEPILIDFNESAYNYRTSRLGNFIQFFNKAIELYDSFNIGKFEPEDFENLVCNTEDFINEKLFISKDFSSVAALGLNKDKLIELMEKPTGYPQLLEQIKRIERIFTNENFRYDFGSIDSIKTLLRYFIINDESKVELQQKHYDSYRKQYETYITTPEGKSILDFGNELLELYDKYGIRSKSRIEDLERLIECNSDTPKLNINYITSVDDSAKRRS